MSIKTFLAWVQFPSLLLLLIAPALLAQNQNVAGNLTVDGRADIVVGPLSLGEAQFYDENNVQADPAQGLTIHYSETPQNWSGSTYVKGKSLVRFQVAQESADFKWQFSEPDGLGGFGSVTLMKLSNDGLTVNGQKNTLPNQTLSAGNASILTLGLGDNRYLNKSGGTISGNLTITGSTLTVNGSNVLTEASDGYIKFTSSNEVTGGGASVTPWTNGIGIGTATVSGYRAVGIGVGSYARGSYSVALGTGADVGGASAIGIGYGSYGAGERSIAIGQFAASHTKGSIVMGYEARSTQIDQIVLGNFNEMAPYSPTYASPSDWLFTIANGTAENARSNALVVKRNGDMEVKGTSLKVNGSEVLHRSGDGYIKVREDGAIIGGFQSVTADWSDGVVIGKYAQAGFRAISIGGHAGYIGALASGDESVSLGYAARAPSSRAIGIGYATWAAGDDVIAIGHGTNTRSLNATAIGRATEANQVGQVVLGAFNELTVQSASPHSSDTIFILGNGSSDTARSNALIVKRNGNMEVKGTSLTVNGLEVVTEDALDAAIDAKIENVNLGGGNYISRNGIYGMSYGDSSTAAAHSMALGQNTTASGSQSSSAIGYYARANQQGTHALGNYVVANRPGQIVLGNYNDYGSPSEGSDTPASSDPVFVIGNGTADNARSNALVIKRDGAIELNGASLKYNNSNVLTEAGGYLTQSSASSTYLTSADAANQYQTKPAPNERFLTSTDLVAIQASIDGKLGPAEIEGIIEDLEDSFLSKDPQVGLAYGTSSSAIAETSAIGKGAKANQAGAHAIGNNVVANRPGQVVVGNYNDYGSTEAGSNVEAATDPVFIVGTGKGGESGQPDVRKNALTIKRNGSIETKGKLSVDGDIETTGVIRVQPAGNLSMGVYQSTPAAP